MDRIDWRAGNSARSRLSGGAGPIRTGPPKLFRTASQPSFYRILFYVCPDTIELRIGSNQAVKALLLPKWSVGAEQQIGLVSSESFQRAQPLGGKHVRRGQKMNIIRHNHESMEVVPVQFPFSVLQCRHHHLCNFRPPQIQRARRAPIQKAVDGHEGFAGGDKCRRRKYPTAGKAVVQPKGDEYGLLDVPMGQTPFIMPHTSLWCVGRREALTASSRLKAGCGQDCPPSNLGREWWMGLL